VPSPERPDSTTPRSLRVNGSDDLVFRTVPASRRVDAFEVRVRGDCSHGRFDVQADGRVLASRSFELAGDEPMRIRLGIHDPPPSPVTIRLKGCADIHAAPPVELRNVAGLYWTESQARAPAADALTVYVRS
jgi:hypothetical protein